MNKRDRERWEHLVDAMADPQRPVVAFVGAGLSSAPPALIPGWRDFFDKLCDACAEYEDADKVAELRAVAETAPQKPQFLLPCFDELRELMGKNVFEREVQDLLKPKSAGIPKAIEILVRCAFRGIITTNLDDLIEDAWDEAAKRGLRASTPELWTGFDGSGQGNLTTGKDWLWRIHGTIHRPNTWVLTLDQYAKTIYANLAHSEALKVVLQTSTVVFVGFGGSDLDLDRILKRLVDLFDGQVARHILLTRGATTELRRRLAALNVDTVDYGGDEDHSALVDLLSQLPAANAPGAPAPVHDDGLAAYRTWVNSETSYIDIRGVAPRGGLREASRFQIEELYTELQVLIPGPGAYDEKPVALTELASETEHLVVEGNAGTGKTTFLKRMAQAYLERGDDWLPVLLNIADFEATTRSKGETLTPRDLIGAVVDRARRNRVAIDAAVIERAAAAGRCVWLLDSFDLIDRPERRKRITKLISSISGVYPGSRVVVVSRRPAIADEVFTRDFERVEIEPLDDDRRVEFISAWSRQLFDDEQQAEAHTYLLWDAIRDSSALRTLATNAMMLTCMAVIHYNGRRLPAARADLLEAVLTWLLDARHANTAGLSTQQALMVYRDLAFAMQDREEGVREHMSRADAAAAIAERFDGDVDRAERFLRAEEEQRGILVTRGDDIRFWHLWFQEYLAAAQIAGRSDAGSDGWEAVVSSERLASTAWKDTLAFVPLCFARLGPDRVDLFLDVLAREATTLTARARVVALGGRALADMRAGGLDHAPPPAWRKLLDEAGAIFTAAPGEIPLSDLHGAGIALGFANTRSENAEIEWAEIEGGEVLIGSQADDPTAPNYDAWATPWEGPVVRRELDAFEISVHPVTVAQFQRFVEAGGYEDTGLWSGAGWGWLDGTTAPKHWEEQLYAPTCPVTWVSYHEAEAFATWVGRESAGYECRLPAEDQWEHAATLGAPADRRFSWGDEISAGETAEVNWARCGLRRKSPVGLFPQSTTPDGVADMLGNVEEWCQGPWRSRHDDSSVAGAAQERRPARGGSTLRYSRLCRPRYRSRLTADLRYESVGFRVVRVPA